MRWKPALFYAFCALIFVAAFMFFTRPEKPAAAKPAAAPSADEIKVPFGDGRWEKLKTSLAQWLRDEASSNPDNLSSEEALQRGRVLTRAQADAWIKDLAASEITSRDGRINIGKWAFADSSEPGSFLVLRISNIGWYGFQDVHYADGKWTYSYGWFSQMTGYPSRSKPSGSLSR